MDLMLDLETWDTRDSAVIRSAALVMFGKKPDEEPPAWLVVDFRDCVDEQLERGRTVSAETQQFWRNQNTMDLSVQLPPSEFPTRVNLYDGLSLIHEFFLTHAPRKVWSRGITFDFSILAHAFTSMRLAIPWKYYSLKDVRSLDDFVPIKRSEHPHNPYYDCLAQIEQVQDLYLVVNRVPLL